MNPDQHLPKFWFLLLVVVVSLVLVLALFAWHVAGAHFALPWFLELALGFGLVGMAAFSIKALALRPALSLRARLGVLFGPVVGCASAGLGSIMLALWPSAMMPLYLFVVSGIAFPIAVTLGIVGFARNGRRHSPASGQ
jgi:hypothetical protein